VIARPSFFERWSRVIRTLRIKTCTTRVYINDREVHSKEAEEIMRRMDEFSRDLEKAMDKVFRR
jgi:hypothetical protein